MAAVTAVTLMDRPVADGRSETARLSLASAPALPIDGQMCAVVAVDIVGFTRAGRDDDIRGYLRERLYEYLEKAFDSCGIPWAECFWEDRGDGALIVVPPELPVKGLIDPLPDKLRRLIRRHNHVSAAAADMQLRVAAHIGPVEHDRHGFVGTDVNFAFRMLDARSLKAKLAKSGAELGLIVSDDVYDKLIRRCPTLAGPAPSRPSGSRPRTPGPGPGPTCPARRPDAFPRPGPGGGHPGWVNRSPGSPSRRPGGSARPHSTSSRSAAAPVSGTPEPSVQSMSCARSSIPSRSTPKNRTDLSARLSGRTRRSRSSGTGRPRPSGTVMSRPWIRSCASAPANPPPGGCHGCPMLDRTAPARSAGDIAKRRAGPPGRPSR